MASPLRRSCRAFTLIEVMIALVLCLALIAAVYLSISMYLRYSTAGRARIERNQLVRALFSQFTADINSVVFKTPDKGADSTGPALGSGGSSGAVGKSSLTDASGASVGSTSTTGGSQTGSSSSTSGGSFGGTSDFSTIGTPQSKLLTGGNKVAAGKASNTGIVGSSDSLTLAISRPLRDESYTAFGGGTTIADRTSDLLAVTYLQAGSDTTALAVAVTAANSSAREMAKGLVRVSVDGLMSQYAQSAVDSETLADEAEIIAKEIGSVQFRYYDGLEWANVWDSSVKGQLPQAIEITLTVEEEVQKTAADIGEPPPIVYTYRHVVAVPLRQPYAGLTSF